MTTTDAAGQAALSDPRLEAVRFDASGLVPVIAQEAATGMIRMVAWANREALANTLASGEAHFWSRSRQAPWRKGESSGHTLGVREVRLDCDGDVVLYLVDPIGPSCHTGKTSCFFRVARVGAAGDRNANGGPAGDNHSDGDDGWREDEAPPDPPPVVVGRVAEVIRKRREARPPRSYVVSLLDAGWPKILGKIREESGELAEALPAGDAAHAAHEAADLLFHVLVGLEAAGVSTAAVFDELRRRFGTSGITEKENRPAKAGAPTTGAAVAATPNADAANADAVKPGPAPPAEPGAGGGPRTT